MLHKRIKYLLLLLIMLTSCAGMADSALDIEWKKPVSWGTGETVKNQDGSYESHSFVFSPDTFCYIEAQKFPNRRKMDEDLDARMEVHRVSMRDGDWVYLDFSKEYSIPICGTEATVMEMVYKPGTIAVDRKVLGIDVWMTLDKTIYSFSFSSSLLDENAHQDFVEEFWDLIDSVECENGE